jgi:hypothetical protein
VADVTSATDQQWAAGGDGSAVCAARRAGVELRDRRSVWGDAWAGGGVGSVAEWISGCRLSS